MKKKNIIQKISSGKGFYIASAVSFGLVVIAIVLVYRTSTGMIKDLLTTLPEGITREVRHNETDETDPRYTTEKEETVPSTTTVSTTEEQETSMAWVNNSDGKVTVTTTVEVTEPVISNDSYVLPLTSEVQKGYSPSSPVFDETMEDWRVHKGIDFSAEVGSEVRSIGNGRVTKVISDPSWGYIIEIDHGDFTARYCGLEQGTAIKNGDTVEKGDIVGKLGTIPCESRQESHLHFEAVKNSVTVDPMSAMGLVSEEIQE
ncbi:MAG: M23 family metallopeptidase [Clostridia bacterium]|nr:M23 family metallopeptidase [Clostridia bacterium]